MKEIFEELITHLKFNREAFVFEAALMGTDGNEYYDTIVDEASLWQEIKLFAEAFEKRIQ